MISFQQAARRAKRVRRCGHAHAPLGFVLGILLATLLSAHMAAAQPLKLLTGRNAGDRKAGPGASAPAAPASEAPAAAAPEAIPVAVIPGAAEQAVTELRAIESRLAPSPRFAAIEHDFTGLVATLGGMRAALQATDLQRLSARDLTDRRSEWLRHDVRLRGWEEELEHSSKTILEDRGTLRTMREVWEKTAAVAQAESLPPAVQLRIRSVQARIGAAASPVQERLAENLTLQDRIAEERMRIAEAVDRLDRAMLEAQETVFVRRSAPLWRTFQRSRRPEAILKEIRASAIEDGRQLREFAATNRTDLLPLGVVFGALVLGVYGLRRRVQRGGQITESHPAHHVLGRGYAAAFLVFMTLFVEANPQAPTIALEIVALLTMMPTIRILSGLVPADLRRALIWLSAALFAELVRSQLPAYSWLARWLTLFESAGMFALLAWVLRRRSGWSDWVVGRWRRACVVLGGVSLVLLAAAAFANIIGKAAFAALVTRGTIVTLYAAVVLYAVQLVLDAGLTALLAPTLQGTSGQVAVGRIRMRMRLSRLVRLLALLSWVAATMLAFGIWGPMADHFLPFVTRRLHIGAATFSLADLLLFAGTLTLSIVAARVLRILLHDGLSRVSLPRGVPAAISTTVQYLILFFGFLLAVLAAGVDVSRFTILVSALGVGVGFGLQNVVNNFVSGIILLYERPILVGDTIEIGGAGSVFGVVNRIGVRSSTVRTPDGAEILVPNANLLSSDVVNWTHSDRQRRIEVTVGIAYGTEPQRVIEILKECARQHTGVLATPAPAALFQGFGDSALNFALRFWTANFDDWMQVRSEVSVAVYEALGRAGIEIPFPQRDVHVRTHDGAARVEVERPAPAGRPLPS